MTPAPSEERTVVVGAGPAGLTAALELGKRGRRGVVFEADDLVGGISRSVEFRGCRLDIGGHRFFTKVREVEDLWHEILGDDLLTRERMSRIYYRDTFFDYPLKPLNALRGLGLLEAFRVVGSWAHSQAFPIRDESTFDAWVSNRFGRRLFQIFFETYTEKVWGMPCSEISAAWAAQRIKNLDLLTALKNAFLRGGTRDGEVVTSLIERFLYPRLGPGMMWERCAELAAAKGLETRLRHRVVRVDHADGRVHAVGVEGPDGAVATEPCTSLVSSMPIGQLVRAFDPPAPPEVVRAAESLRYRDFLIVGLIADREELFPDNWIYVHAPEVRVGRVQNFKNWSPEMVSDPSLSFIGMEYFVDRGDDLWTMADDDLVRLGSEEAERIGLFAASEVRDGTVVRMPRAYPVYDGDYEGHVATLRTWLDGFSNLWTVGRNGQHRYNNQDHSMLAGLYAARCVDGAELDLWAINVEESFHEEIRDDEVDDGEGRSRRGPSGDRLVPARVESDLEGFLAEAFAFYDPVAAGGAVGITAALGLVLATLVPLVGPDPGILPMLAHLGQYLVGYRLSWIGLAAGAAGAAMIGFVLAWATTHLLNVLVAASERDLERRLANLTTLEALTGGQHGEE